MNQDDSVPIEPPDSIAELDLSIPDDRRDTADAPAPEEKQDVDTVDDENSEDAADKGELTDAKPSEQAEQEDVTTDQSPKEGEMTEKERNAHYASRRIEAKRNGDKFIDTLRDEATKFLESQTDESEYEDIDPAVANKLREMEEYSRSQRVKDAVQQVERVRENTALSFAQAENTIDMFNPRSDSFNERLAVAARQDYAEAHLETRPVTDADGNVVEYQIVGVKAGSPSPLDYLARKAKEWGDILGEREAIAQANVQRNRAGSDQAPATAPRAAGNSLEDLEDRIGDIKLA